MRCIERIFRMIGWTEDQIYRAKLWWNNLKIRLLPEAYYRLSWEYVEWKNDELKRAYAILQRMQQLSQEGGDEVYIYNLHPDIPSMVTSINHTDQHTFTDEDRRQDLRRLRAEICKLQKGLVTGWSNAPDNAVTWIYRKYWWAYKDGRTRIWNHRRQKCADGDGCCACARTCGCCEKVLYEYWSRDYRNQGRGLENTGSLQKVYGHCTAECACCVITHGVYEPGFIAEGRSNS
ncbi:hypothetical protein BDW59DRAFT_151718 [Aspergillus cavernicola]|uniref:Uncharacterized protein n=1 Tax=Aspergillus cavernicola TaxID=176166 RepID=A0ABR4HU84_9EURO